MFHLLSTSEKLILRALTSAACNVLVPAHSFSSDFYNFAFVRKTKERLTRRRKMGGGDIEGKTNEDEDGKEKCC